MSAIDQNLFLVNKKKLQLPINRIKTIMKSSPDVETIGQEALYVVTKCTELFIQYLTKNTFNNCQTKEKLDYGNLASYVGSKMHLDFLTELIPPKMTVEQCKELIRQYEEEQSSPEISDSDSLDDDGETSVRINSGSNPQKK